MSPRHANAIRFRHDWLMQLIREWLGTTALRRVALPHASIAEAGCLPSRPGERIAGRGSQDAAKGENVIGRLFGSDITASWLVAAGLGVLLFTLGSIWPSHSKVEFWPAFLEPPLAIGDDQCSSEDLTEEAC